VSEPLFLRKEAVLAYHEQQIQLYGGDPGILDEGLLESALAQPENTWLYMSEADVFDVAAAYAFHIAKNHPFTDGNKRTAHVVAAAFLEINGWTQDVPEPDIVRTMIGVADASIDERALASWFRKTSRKI